MSDKRWTSSRPDGSDGEMGDEQLDGLIAREREQMSARNVPVDDMWLDIASRSSLGASRSSGINWRMWGGMAATLLLGFALGRVPLGRAGVSVAGVPVAGGAAAPTEPHAAAVAHPYDQTTADLLGETTVLLAALPAGREDATADERISREAAKLLVTTRLLLDSQASADGRLRTLLEDLELVLAQMARLRATPKGDNLELINEALQERELVPRIRTYAAKLAASAD